MSFRTAVIGDIHGNFGAVSSLFSIVRPLVDRLIFVGDYVNRGSHSREVMQFLVEKKRADQSLIFLRGNHDRAFLDCLARGQLVPFLRIGGAKTIRSYVRSPHGDVLAQLRLEVPSEHVDFLEQLQESFQDPALFVSHEPQPVGTSSAFRVHGHKVLSSTRPYVTNHFAAIDTGCGTLPSGRLTALIFPERAIMQVDCEGETVLRPSTTIL